MVDAGTPARRRQRVDPLDVARSLVGEQAEQFAAADDLVTALGAVGQLAAAVSKARERLAVAAVLDEGWSYTRLGQALGITRQAAHKVYEPAVQEALRRPGPAPLTESRGS